MTKPRYPLSEHHEIPPEHKDSLANGCDRCGCPELSRMDTKVVAYRCQNKNCGHVMHIRKQYPRYIPARRRR